MLRRRKADALKGALDLLVLTTLSRGPEHGYGIAAYIQSISDEMLRIEEGSLYLALHRMEQVGWIRAEWRTTENKRRARIYRLTRAGEKRLEEEQAKWERLTTAIGRFLRYA